MRTRFLRGNTQENNGLTLPAGELSVDLERRAVRLHDGTTLGGFEMVGSPIEFPSPGPTQLLAGDMQRGFYGEVSSNDLITGTSLATEIGLSSGNVENDMAGWLKYAYQDKTLYIAKKPIRHNLSWQDIYQAGAVYGTDDNGVLPSGGNRLQDARVVIGDFTFKVRLLTGGNGEPSTASGGEWNQLIYPVRTDDPNGDNWQTFTNEDIDVGLERYTLCMEEFDHTSTTYSYRVVRGRTSLGHFVGVGDDTSNTVYGWRPVLELIE